MQLHSSNADQGHRDMCKRHIRASCIHCTVLHVHVSVELSCKMIIIRHVMNKIASYASA